MTTRVLQVVYGLGMGGAETWLISLLEVFGRTGEIETHILSTCGEPRVLDDEARHLGAKLHYIPYNRREVLSFRRAFRDLLHERRYDAIHDHQDIQSGFHFALAGRHVPPVRIAHFHNAIYQLDANYGTNPLRRATVSVGKWLVTRHATHILGTSNELLRDYGFGIGAVGRQRRGALHCGFDTHAFLADREAARAALCAEFSWPKSAKIVLFVGRIDFSAAPNGATNQKNSGLAVNVLIEAMANDLDLVAILAGAPSPAVPELQRRIDAAGLCGRIVLAGVRRDIPQLMAASDVLFFPSRGEGLGMVAVQAQAAGLPVVASSAVPGECVVVPEMVRFIDLGAPHRTWIDALNAAISARPDRVAANTQVAASRFDIRLSAMTLARLYRTGEYNGCTITNSQTRPNKCSVGPFHNPQRDHE